MTIQSRVSAETGAADAEVIQLSRHEPEAFEILFRRHAGHIQRYVVRRLGADAADDLVAETFLLAFRQRDRYDMARADARPWLYGIVTNLIGSHRRAEVRQYRALARTGTDPVTEPFTDRVDAAVSAGAANKQLAAALARLPAVHRDTLLLAAWGDLSYEEAAAALGVPVGTVRSRLSRARSRLRRALGDADPSSTKEENQALNEMDLLSRMRDEVPLGVSPRAEHLFRTALLESGNPERAAVPSRHSGRRGARVAWRPVLAVSLTAAVAAAVVVLPSRGQAPAGRQAASGLQASGRAPSGQPASPVKLLADRAAAAALSGPAVKPGQWVYRETELSGKAGKSEKKGSQELWSTADDNTEASYYNGKLSMYYRGGNYDGVQGVVDFFPEPVGYGSLGSLPAQPGALVKRLAEIGARSNTGEPAGCSQSGSSCTAFLVISELLSSYVMPPALTAEMYQALGDIPGVSVVSNVDVAGQPYTGFRIPLKGGYVELIINSSTYQYVATQGSFPGGVQGSIVVASQALVPGPGVRP